MENSSEKVAKGKGGNPNWTKGTSGNPSGRPPNHFGKYLRQHPNVPLVIEKIMDSALFTEGKYTQGLTAQLSQAALREKLFYNKCIKGY